MSDRSLKSLSYNIDHKILNIALTGKYDLSMDLCQIVWSMNFQLIITLKLSHKIHSNEKVCLFGPATVNSVLLKCCQPDRTSSMALNNLMTTVPLCILAILLSWPKNLRYSHQI